MPKHGKKQTIIVSFEAVSSRKRVVSFEAAGFQGKASSAVAIMETSEALPSAAPPEVNNFHLCLLQHLHVVDAGLHGALFNARHGTGVSVWHGMAVCVCEALGVTGNPLNLFLQFLS